MLVPYFAYTFILQFFITLIAALILTPIVRFIAFRIGAVDMPNARRINKKPMPSAGGLAIFLAFSLSVLFGFQEIELFKVTWPIVLGGAIVVITGLLDDIFELKPWQKLVGITLAALEAYFVAGIEMDSISFPFFGWKWELGWLSLPVTIIWILALTNAVNLIDGLDGLAAGVSIIGLITLGIISFFFLLPNDSLYTTIIIFTLVAAIGGFIPYNFFPASIYLGDTGALFLGYMISIVSMTGLKNATFISILTPMLILGVPITDTVYAMIRRKFNKQKISSADKMHLHHRLISIGFTHRGAVLTIYALALVFSFIALLMNYASTTAMILLIIATMIGLELFIEVIGLVGENRQPLIKLLKFIGNRQYRNEVLHREEPPESCEEPAQSEELGNTKEFKTDELVKRLRKLGMVEPDDSEPKAPELKEPTKGEEKTYATRSKRHKK
ncbi:MraY family glycosyltransferase [Enterococcus sp. 2201sp1_2201st1_B8_2201SCRN_220225]|uniref:MraY family glycosyltransferase n=1 Tax=unclassified Enterococcus TaxID=2608891 RepID=UPI0034A15A47